MHLKPSLTTFMFATVTGYLFARLMRLERRAVSAEEMDEALDVFDRHFDDFETTQHSEFEKVDSRLNALVRAVNGDEPLDDETVHGY
jgi:hypothetical protein